MYATATDQYVELDVTELWNIKVRTLATNVMRIARGDEDLYQEGIIGIRDGILRDPGATDSYLLQAARYAMTSYRNRGRSVDNGSRRATRSILADGTVRTYRKAMVPIYIDHLMSDFQMEYPESSYQPDILAIDKLCAEKFYSLLSEAEADFVDVSIDALGGRNRDSRTMRQMGIGRPTYNRLRMSTRRKFIRGFGTDEEIERLDQHEAMEDMHE